MEEAISEAEAKKRKIRRIAGDYTEQSRFVAAVPTYYAPQTKGIRRGWEAGRL